MIIISILTESIIFSFSQDTKTAKMAIPTAQPEPGLIDRFARGFGEGAAEVAARSAPARFSAGGLPNRNTETTPGYSGFPNGNGGTQGTAPVSENPAKGTGRKKTGAANDECILAYIRQLYFLKPETLVSDAIRAVRKAGYSGANEKFISMIHTVKAEMENLS